MAQIVHDLAPAAAIDFESAFIGEDEFADSIGKLADQGADVIVDDVTYFDEPMYQDGVVAQAVTAARARGVDYFSSSANNRNVYTANPNTPQATNYEVGSYEAVDGYRPTPCPTAIAAQGYLDCHNFNTSGTADPGFSFTANGTALQPIVNWGEPFNGVQTDLDVLLVDSATGAVVSGSGNQNPGTDGSQKAYEFFSANLVAGRSYDLVVARFPSAAPATPRFKMIFAENGRKPFRTMERPAPSGTDVMGPTAFGHNGSESAMSVGASDVRTPTTGLNGYSSYGPVTILFAPATGTTPAAALPAPKVLTKPDLVASDCGLTTFFASPPPNNQFCGTSAAAPHAAAIAALLLQQEPTATSEQVNAAMVGTADAIAGVPAGFQGGGFVNALAAGTAIAATAPAAPTLTATNPPSPNPSLTPRVIGTAPVGTTVQVFTNATCQGAPAATGSATDFATVGLTVTVAPRATTAFSASASSGGTASACSTTPLTYKNTLLAGATPTVTGTNPASPAASTTPAVVGTAPSGSTVAVFTNATCTGQPAATGSAAAFAAPGISVSVAPGSTTRFWASASDAQGNVSACSTTSATYTQQSAAPSPAPDTTLTSVPGKKVVTRKAKAKVSFEFTATVPGATFTCSLDGKAFEPCVSGVTYRVKKGKHTFAVRAAAGGVVDPTAATYAFKVKRKAGKKAGA